MATIEQAKRLAKLNKTTDWHKVNLKRRWGLTCSSQRYGLNLASIWYITHDINLNPPKKLIEKIGKFKAMYPQFKKGMSDRTTARLLMTLFAYQVKGLNPGPIHHLATSLCWLKDTEYRGFTDKPKLKEEMYKKMEDLGIVEELFRLAKRLLKEEGDKIHLRKEQYWLKDKDNLDKIKKPKYTIKKNTRKKKQEDEE